MNYELLLWLMACSIGLATASLSWLMAVVRVRALSDSYESRDVLDAARHLRSTEFERVIGWTLFLGAGVLATFDPVPANPSALFGLIRWVLVSTVVLWSYKTASDYLFTRRQLRRAREKLKGTP